MNEKWTARRAMGPSMRVVLLPGKPPEPFVRLKRSQLQGRLAILYTKCVGEALCFVGLEAAQVSYVRAHTPGAKQKLPVVPRAAVPRHPLSLFAGSSRPVVSPAKTSLLSRLHARIALSDLKGYPDVWLARQSNHGATAAGGSAETWRLSTAWAPSSALRSGCRPARWSSCAGRATPRAAA